MKSRSIRKAACAGQESSTSVILKARKPVSRKQDIRKMKKVARFRQPFFMLYLWVMRKILIAPLLGLIYLYKYLIAPLLPRGCRHYPTCSTYAVDALNMHGPVRGSLLAASRIARCNPWGTFGFDPVPRFLIKRADLRRFSGRPYIKYPSCDRLKPH
jgi:hypothetical protein